NLRNQTHSCVWSQTPSVSDFVSRVNVAGADLDDEPIDLKHFIHKLHTGASLEHAPYVIYGFGNAPNEFSDVLYPGDRRDCARCHVTSPEATYLLPLPAGALPTPETMISGGIQTLSGLRPP